MLQISQDIQKQLQSGQIDEAQAAALIQSQAERTLGALWKLNVLDIEKTLDRVCTAILQQPGAPRCFLSRVGCPDRGHAIGRAQWRRTLGPICSSRHKLLDKLAFYLHSLTATHTMYLGRCVEQGSDGAGPDAQAHRQGVPVGVCAARGAGGAAARPVPDAAGRSARGRPGARRPACRRVRAAQCAGAGVSTRSAPWPL